MDDKELIELAARAAGLGVTWEPVHKCFWISFDQGIAVLPWLPLDNDGDALRLAVKLRINIMFNGSFHHVGTDHRIFDICCLGGMNEIRRAIVRAAAAMQTESGAAY